MSHVYAGMRFSVDLRTGEYLVPSGHSDDMLVPPPNSSGDGPSEGGGWFVGVGNG